MADGASRFVDLGIRPQVCRKRRLIDTLAERRIARAPWRIVELAGWGRGGWRCGAAGGKARERRTQLAARLLASWVWRGSMLAMPDAVALAGAPEDVAATGLRKARDRCRSPRMARVVLALPCKTCLMGPSAVTMTFLHHHMMGPNMMHRGHSAGRPAVSDTPDCSTSTRPGSSAAGQGLAGPPAGGMGGAGSRRAPVTRLPPRYCRSAAPCRSAPRPAALPAPGRAKR